MSYGTWVITAVGLFIAGFVLGLMVPGSSLGLFLDQAAAIEEMSAVINPLPQVVIFLFIFLKNISVVVISFIMSPLFCFIPVITLIVNGGVIGLVSAVVVEEISVPFLLAGLLPHGIFEIPALMMGEAVALSFGVAALRGLFSRDKKEIIMPNLRNNLKYMLICVGLFLVAAVIETWLTPVLLESVV